MIPRKQWRIQRKNYVLREYVVSVGTTRAVPAGRQGCAWSIVLFSYNPTSKTYTVVDYKVEMFSNNVDNLYFCMSHI